jgi:poly-beta-1,6-N-acetyl-D-glucosamine synthase
LYIFIYYNFLFGSIVQILYWVFFFSRLAARKEKPLEPSTAHRPISVVICAKNEARNLQSNLPLILSQYYANYEVIVVNDRSTDNSFEILNAFQKIYPHLKIVHLLEKDEQAMKGKKFALTEGIAAANHDILLLTDADCQPVSKYWIDFMQQHLTDEKQIGLGYGPLFKVDKATSFGQRLLNQLARFETVQTAIQYFSAAWIGIPYMGVGRNIIYYKSLFEKNDGFKKHSHIASGDDDLFINQVATKENTAIILHPKTHMYSAAKADWQGFYTQKTRHVSTSVYYQPRHKIYLGLFFTSFVAFHIYSILLLLLNKNLDIILITFGLKTLFAYLIGHSIFKKLNAFDLWLYLPLLDFVYLLYLMRMLPSTIIRNTNKWN